MKATLYEALGISQTATDEEVRAALRGQIRKYYAKTRDGRGNVEEALRFINHASRILSDPERRAQYDHELAVSGGTIEERIAHVVSSAVAEGGGKVGKPGSADGAPAPGEIPGVGLAAAEPEVARKPDHPGLTERVASLHRSTTVAIVLCVLFGVGIAAAIVFVTPADAAQVAKQILVGLALSLLAVTVVYGVVHGIAWGRRRHVAEVPDLIQPAELAILNWRREKSVFLGTNQPQEDAGWIFQLRMAELERAKSGRTSEPHPWSRLGARLFDYALWGLLLAIPLSELRSAGGIPETLAHWLGHPLLAPVLITVTWIPIEALLIASIQTTPGKRLFGVYLQFSISDAYATHDPRAQFERAGKRAFRVWWEGVGCGFPLLAPILIAVAYERVAQSQETAWDFAQDCLVTHGPPGGLNTMTGVAGLAAMLWLYGVAWHQSMAESIESARSSIADALPLLRSRFPGDATPGGPAGPGSAVQRGPPPAVADGTGATASSRSPVAGAGNPTSPIDPAVAALFAQRQARVAALSGEARRMLEAKNWARASEACRAWADLELGNANAWRCLGRALEAQGHHREAVSAFRKAKQYDPGDSTLDAAISRSQHGIVADFLSRRGH